MSQRTIVITGATRGLGRALLDHFIPQGHRVAGCGRNAEHVEQLRLAFPAGHFAVVDVGDAISVKRWAEQVQNELGTPGLLINNAAVMNVPGKLWTIPAADFDRTIDINVKGVANVIRAFVPGMVAAGAGIIVNLSSGWGRSTSPDVAPYCASKYAVEGMTKALAQELPKGMAAIPLNPGIIDTEMLRSTLGDGAGNYGNAAKWATRAAPMILGFTAADNGKSLSIPA